MAWKRIVSLVAIVSLLGAPAAYGVSLDWNPGFNPPTWDSVSPLWLNGATPSPFSAEATAVFGATGVGTVNVDNFFGPVQVGGIKFNAAGYTIQAFGFFDRLDMGGTAVGTSGNIDVGAPLTPINGTATMTVPMLYAFGLATGPTWTVHNASDSLLVTGAVDMSANNLTLAGAGSITIGTVGVTTFTTGGGMTIASTGTGAKSIVGGISTWYGTTLTLDVADNLAISGDIIGAAALAKAGAGTLTLSGTNGLDNLTPISMTAGNGTLLLGSDGALGGYSGPVLNFGGGNVGAVGVRDIANVWTASGDMRIVGAGTLILSDTTTPVSMAAGPARTLDVAAGAAVQIAGNINLGGNTLNLTGGGAATLANVASTGGSTLAVNGAGSYTFGGPITSSGAAVNLTLAGGGVTTLSAANTGLGGTVAVPAGNTLRLGNVGSLGGATLALAGGNVGVAGPSPIALTNAVTYTGNRIGFSSGDLSLAPASLTFAHNDEVHVAAGATGTLAAPAVTLGGTLRLTGNGALKLGTAGGAITSSTATYAFDVSGAGSNTLSGPLTQAKPLSLVGGGTLTLTGSNNNIAGATLTGAQTTLALAGVPSLGAGTIALNNGTRFDLGGLVPFNMSVFNMTEGVVAGAFELTALPGSTTPVTFPEKGYTSAKPPWGDNETWVYQGKFTWDGGPVSFAANIDDGTLLKIDGVQWINDNTWNNVDVATQNLSAGTHDIEIRFGNGTGGAGPSGQAGWTNTFGFGFDPQARNGTAQANYLKFESQTVYMPNSTAFNSPTTGVNVQGNAEISLNNYTLPTATLGPLTRNNDGGTLTVNGTNKTVVFSGTSFLGGGGGHFDGTGSIDLGAINPAARTVATLSKQNAGSLSFTTSAGSPLEANLVELSGGNFGSAGGTLAMVGGSPQVKYLAGSTTAAKILSPINLGNQPVAFDVPTVAGVAVPLTVATPITGGASAKLVKTGSGAMQLSNPANSFGAGIEVTGGELTLRDNGSGGSGPITLQDGTTLRIATTRPTVNAGLQQGRIASGTFTMGPATVVNRGIVLQPWAGQTQKVGAGTPPGTAWPDQSGPTGAQWGDNEHWVYKGQIYIRSGQVSFAGNIDDNMGVILDGVILPTISGSNWTYGSGIINCGLGPNGDGWHDIEIRFQNGGGGAGATGSGNGFSTSLYGFGYNDGGNALIPITGTNLGSDKWKPVDPGDGSLFRIAGAAPNFTGGNALTVHGNATVDIAWTDVGSVDSLGTLTRFADGGTLTVVGVNRTLKFAATDVSAAGSGVVTFAGNANLGLGQILRGSATPTLDVQSTGSLSFDYSASLVNLTGLTVNVAPGSRVSAVGGGAGTFDPVKGAAFTLNPGAIFQVSSTAAGSPAMTPTLTFVGDPIIEHAGPYTDTLGGPSSPINVPFGSNVTLNGLGGKLILAGDINGLPAALTKTGPAAMQLLGALSGGNVVVNQGNLQLGASERIPNASNVTVNATGQFDLNGVTETLNVLRVNSAGTVATGSGRLVPGVLEMVGGTIDMRGGGTLVQPAGGVSLVAGGGNRAVILGGTIEAAGGYAFHVADGPHPVDLSVSSLLTAPNSVTKDGAGTLFLANRDNSFTGLNWSGVLAINGNGALGAASNVVALNGTKSLKYLNFMDPLMTPGIGASIVIPATRSITIDPVAGGTIDVSTDIGYWYGEDTTILSYAGQITGAGKFVKAGAAGLELTNSTLYANAPTSTVVQMGQLRLTSQNALGVAAPTITVGHKGKLQLANAVAYDLSNVVMGGWSHPYAFDTRPYGYNWAWYGSRLDVTGANLGSVATAKFPATDIMGWLDLGTQGNAINAGDGTTSRVPRMGSWSEIRTGGNTVGMNVVLNGMTWLRASGSTPNWDGAFSGSGGLVRIDGQNINIRGANTFTGPLVINHSNGNSTWVVSTGTSATNPNSGTIATADIQVLLGNFQLDDSGTQVIAQRLTNSSVNVQLMGGQFRYKGVSNAASTQTVPKTTLVGSPQITVERVGTGTPTFMLTTLDRPAGSTANFVVASGTLGTDSFIKIGGGTGALPTTGAVTPWAYVNNLDWAVYDAANGVKTFTGYTSAWPAPPSTTADVQQTGSVTVDGTATTATVNSLALRGSGTLTINTSTSPNPPVPLIVTSGGILQNASSGAGNWVIAGGTQGNALQAGATGNAELVIFNNNRIDVNAPVQATGLTKNGGGELWINAQAVASDFRGGEIHVNAGTLFALTPAALANSGKIVLSGGEIRPRESAENAWNNNILVLADSAIRPGHNGANDNLRRPMGDLTVAMGRRLNLYQENSHSIQFANVNLEAGAFINLDASTSTAAKAWQFAVNSGQKVTMGGPVFLNMWGGLSEWGQLDWRRTGGTIDVPAVDRRWAVTGGSIMTLKAAAASDYSAAVDLHYGHVVVAADNALGSGSTVNVWAPSTLEFAVTQSAYPTIVLDQYAAIGGQLGGDTSIFAGGANKITLPATDAIFLRGTSITPDVGTRGLAKDWLGVQGADMNAGVLTMVDPSSQIYRGVALLPNGTASVDPYFYGDLASASGDLNVFMGGSTSRYATIRIRPSSTTAVQQINSASGVVNFYGPTEVRWSGNGGNGPQGSFTTINRMGTAETQNNWLWVFYDGYDSLRAGKTLNITDGRIGLVAGSDAAVNAGATVNVLTNATLYLDGNFGERNPATGTWNVAVDAAIAPRRLDKLTGGATFNLATGSQFYVISDSADSNNTPLSAAVFANQGDKVDYVWRADADQNDVFTGTGFLVGEGRRLTTGWANDARLGKRGTLLGNGFGWAPGATNIAVTAANGRTFRLNDVVTVPNGKVLNIGDAALYVTNNGDDMTRRQVAQDGAVEFDILTLDAGGKINLVNGALRLMENVSPATTGTLNPAIPFTINGIIDDTLVKASTFQGGGPVLDIRAGRDGATRVAGTGKVLLGLGEDIRLMADENSFTTAAPGRMNTFPVAIEVLGASETTPSGSPAVTGLLRGIRGNDSTNWSGIARFGNVRMRDGASVFLTSDNETACIADFVMLGNGAVYFGRGDTFNNQGVMRVGNVSAEGAGVKTLTVGRTTGENQNDLVGTIGANVIVDLVSNTNQRMTAFSLDGTNAAGQFALAGGTVRLAGTGEKYLGTDSLWGRNSAYTGTGTIDHTSTTSNLLRIWAGSYGIGGLTDPNTLILLNNNRTIMGYANEIAAASAGTPRIVNNIQATVRLATNATGILRGERATDNTVTGLPWFRNVELYQGAQLRLQQSNDTPVFADVKMVGNAMVFSTDAATLVGVGAVTNPTGQARTLTIGGTQGLHLVGPLNGTDLVISSTGRHSLDAIGALDGSNPPSGVAYSAFNLNGRTITMSLGDLDVGFGGTGSSLYGLVLDPGAGTIQHTTTGGVLRVVTGALGVSNMTAATVINLGSNREVRGQADSVVAIGSPPLGSPRVVNNVAAKVVLAPGAAGIAGSEERTTNTYKGLVRFNNVELNEGSSLRLRQQANVGLMVDVPNLLGNATITGTDSAGDQWVGNVTAGLLTRTLTVSGSQPVNLGGTLTRTNVLVTNTAATQYISGISALTGSGAPYSTFNLNGQTVTFQSNGNSNQLLVNVDPGTGTLRAQRGTVVPNVDAANLTVELAQNNATDFGTLQLAANRQIGALIYNGGAMNPAGFRLALKKALGGVGTVSAANMAQIDLLAGATPGTGAGLAPGVGQSTGTLTLGASLTLPANSVYSWKLDSDAASFDQVAVQGDFALSATPTLKVLSVGASSTEAASYDILTWTGADPAAVAWNVDTSGSASPTINWRAGNAGTWEDSAKWLQYKYTGGNVQYLELDGSPQDGTTAGGILRLSGMTHTEASTVTFGPNSRVVIAPSGGGANVTGPGSDLTIRSLQVGSGAAANTMTVPDTATLTVSEATTVNALSTLNIDGGLATPSLTSAGRTNLNPGSIGAVDVSTVSGRFDVAGALTGTTINSSGTLNFNAGATGLVRTVSVTGGTAAFQSGAATAVTALNLSGGTTTVQNASIATANVSAGAAQLNLAGKVSTLNVSAGQVAASAGAAIDTGTVQAGSSVHGGANQLTVNQKIILPDLYVAGTSPFKMGGNLTGATPTDQRSVVLQGGTVQIIRDPLSAGLLGYWNFNETSGLTAANAVATGPAGVLTNMTGSEWQTGAIPGRAGLGNAIHFSGATGNQVVMGPVGISGNAPRTISGWAKWDGTTSGGQWTTLFGFTPTNTTNGTFFDMEVNNAGTRQYVLHYYATDNVIQNVDVNAWHHWVATSDGTQSTVYMDGGTAAGGLQWTFNAGFPLNTNDQFRVGGRPEQNGWLNGWVDDVRVYDRALSASEAAALFAFNGAGFTGMNLPETRLVVSADSTAAIDTTGAATFAGLTLSGGKVAITGPSSVVFNGLTATGAGGGLGLAGTATIAGNVNLAAASVTEVVTGTTRLELQAGSSAVIGSGAKVKVDSTATELVLAGPISALSDGIRNAGVENAKLLRIADAASQTVGHISGTGSTTVGVGSSLTADSIVQDTLTIGAGGSVIISATGGGAAGASASNAVPEPATWALLAAGAGMLVLVRRFRRKK